MSPTKEEFDFLAESVLELFHRLKTVEDILKRYGL